MAQVTLSRWLSVDPRRNCFRTYLLELGPDLWGETCLVKAWGRIGGRSHHRFHWPRDSQELAQLLQEALRRREQHGYKKKREGGV